MCVCVCVWISTGLPNHQFLREDSPQLLQRHKCLQGRRIVSLTSVIQITHSAPRSSSISESPSSLPSSALSVWALFSTPYISCRRYSTPSTYNRQDGKVKCMSLVHYNGTYQQLLFQDLYWVATAVDFVQTTDCDLCLLDTGLCANATTFTVNSYNITMTTNIVLPWSSLLCMRITRAKWFLSFSGS